MVVDTSALLAYFDRTEAAHASVTPVIEAADARVISPYVLAELDYLVASRNGRQAELSILAELLEGDWELAVMTDDDVQAAYDLLASYDETVGLADASNLVLAQRYRQDEIATLDRRHFSYLRMPGGKPLTVVP